MTIEDYMNYKCIANLILLGLVLLWSAYDKWKNGKNDRWPKL